MRFKRTLALAVSIALAFSCIPGQAFAANKYVNRQDALAKVIKATQNDNFAKAKSNASKKFKDYKAIKKSARKYVGIALKNKVVKKTKKFMPKSKVTRLDFAKWLEAAIKKNGANIAATKKLPKFKDVKKSQKKIVKYVYVRSLMDSVSKKKFVPKAKLTAKQLKVILKNVKRALEGAKEDEELPMEPSPTATPEQEATSEPTQEATGAPTNAPTSEPTQESTITPTQEATQQPTVAPTPSIKPADKPNPANQYILDSGFEVTEYKNDSYFRLLRYREYGDESNGRIARGLFGKGMWVNGGYSTSNVKDAGNSDGLIPASCEGENMLVLLDAKMTKSSNADLEIRIVARGNPNTTADKKLVINSSSFGGRTNEWRTFTQNIKLPTSDELGMKINNFRVEIACNGGEFIIDNLRCLETDETSNVIKNFKFEKSKNPGLPIDIIANVDEDKREIQAYIPQGVDIKALVPTFEAMGTVQVNGENQTSGQNAHDFSKELMYYVLGDNNNVARYSVNVKNMDTGLHSVVIDTNNCFNDVLRDKETYVQATISINGTHKLAPTEVQMKGRGNSSWWMMDKKSFRLKFPEKTSVLGFEEEKNWVLLANQADRTLIRNYLAFETAKKFTNMEYVPKMEMVDLFIDNQYVGAYLMGDHIERSSNKVDLPKLKEGDTEISFLLEVDSRAHEEGTQNVDWFNSPNYSGQSPYALKYPDGVDMTASQFENIRSYISDTEKAIQSGDKARIDSLIDIDSFVDWVLVEELFKNTDSSFFSSCYMYRRAGEKLKMGPIWDLDLSCGNINYADFVSQSDGFYTMWASWYGDLYNKYPGFRQLLKKRWNELKATAVDTLDERIDQLAIAMDKAQAANFKVWPIYGTYHWPIPSEVMGYTEYSQHIAYLKNWLAARITWLDREYNGY